MSRLWLERRALSVFSDGSRLHVGKQLLTAVHASSDEAALPHAADALLRQAASARWIRPRLDVMLGGAASRVVVLPWQDRLRTASQRLYYAQVCLEDSGATASDGWSVQYGYRRYGHDGIAYGLRSTHLDCLKELASVHRLRLRSVLPLAAAAYWRAPLTRRSGMLLLLREADRVSLLRFTGPALSAIDVQPCGGHPELALRRLLRRAQASAAPIDTIGCWSVQQDPALESVAAGCYPNALVRSLPERGWE